MKISFQVRIDDVAQWIDTDGAIGVGIQLRSFGSPEGVVTAPFGIQCQEFDASNNLVKVWIKQTKEGNTGWA